MTLSPAGETTIALVMVGGIMAINLGGKLTISLPLLVMYGSGLTDCL